MGILLQQLQRQGSLSGDKVIAVEAEDSACLKAALDAGHPVDLPRVGLFAEGVAVKRIGDETFRLCQEYLDDIILPAEAVITPWDFCSAVRLDIIA